MFSSEKWFGGGADNFYSHTIDQSLRFEDGDSPYLSRTPSSAGNRKTWTWSAWVKRGNLGLKRLFTAGTSGSSYIQIRFDTNDEILCSSEQPSLVLNLKTTQKFRDLSAWYHIVVAMDTTQSTAANRTKLYINGSQVTDFSSSTRPTQNTDLLINSTTAHMIGALSYSTTSNPYDGYMAEVNFIDGQALTPASFGETKAGIWIPKDTSGLTFGTNGFRLKFQDSSALGDDTSGNGNDYTSNGLAATDVVLDSPTNNWCTINPLSSRGTQSEGNLKTVTEASGYSSTVGSMGHTSGKWYWEVVPTSAVSGGPYIGVVDETYDSTNSGSAVGYLLGNDGVDSIAYYFNGNKYINGTGSSYGASYTTDDIIGVALNLDDNEITFYKNNASQGTISHTFSGNNILPAVSDGSNTSSTVTFIFNFGQDSSFAGTKTAQGNTDDNGNGDFYYSPPSGFLALCTANLPNPGIDPAEDEEPADHFNTVLYTGNGSSISDTQAISGVGFSPDWTWIKARSASYSHVLNDSVRGAGKNLFSDSDTTENVGGSSGDLFTSFDSDGFTVNYKYGGGSNAAVNGNGTTYVSWNWKVNGGSTSNVSAGSSSNIRLIGGGTADQAAVQANTKAGISIVSFENTARSSSDFLTFPHGLNSTPEMVWVKSRDSANYWAIFHASAGSSTLGFLGSSLGSNAFISSSFWNSVNSSTVKFASNGNISATNEDIIAYCFHSVEGYSKMGSFTGNNSPDGPFVYTGFRPALVIVKNSTGTESWGIGDSIRSPINPANDRLYPNLSNVEYSTGDWIDLVSNGFKSRGTAFNTSSATYIYLAFAEQPFKYSNAR